MNDAAPVLSDTDSRMANRIRLEEAGYNLFPAEAYAPSQMIAALEGLYREAVAEGKSETKTVRIAGRITGIRDMGSVVFLDIWQQHCQVQVKVLKKEVAEDVAFVVQHLNRLDHIGVEGAVTRTPRGELTIIAKSLTILCKPRTAPAIGKRDADGFVHEAHSDRGQLLRDKRHISFMTNKKIWDNIYAYAEILRAFREVMRRENYLEVQTSIMARFYGGAAATPFVTRSKALKEELFLRVSPEPDLKRLLAGGFDRVYEIGRNFRNEGVDATHQPSFTAFEAYATFTDYKDMMNLTETLVREACEAVNGCAIAEYDGKLLDFSKSWPRFRMIQLVADKLGVTEDALNFEFLKEHWDKCGFDGNSPTTWGELLLSIFENQVEHELIQPCFVVDYPIETSPLTKPHREDKRLVERFEAFANGMEIANAYSELNDPIAQRERLKKQDLVRDEPYGVDEYFLSAIDDGLPQAGGLGIGFDRIAMIICNAKRISDVIPFPLA